jgi:hypothetical protein
MINLTAEAESSSTLYSHFRRRRALKKWHCCFLERGTEKEKKIGCAISANLHIRAFRGKAKWEKPLADLIVATGVGLLGQDKWHGEMGRVERNDGWRREPFI